MDEEEEKNVGMRGRAVTMITFKELFSELTKTHFRPKIFLPEDMNNAVVHHTRESVLLSKIDFSINIPSKMSVLIHVDMSHI